VNAWGIIALLSGTVGATLAAATGASAALAVLLFRRWREKG